MQMLRIGNIIVNLDHVTRITPGDPSGTLAAGLILSFVDQHTQLFMGEDAEGLLAYLDRTVKSAKVPLKDFEGT